MEGDKIVNKECKAMRCDATPCNPMGSTRAMDANHLNNTEEYHTGIDDSINLAVW